MSDRSSGALICLRQVTKVYRTFAGAVEALRGADLTIETGEFVALFGRSGAGKSTLINLVTGIDRPSGGSIEIGGQRLEALSEEQLTRWRGRKAGVVFQSFQLMPTLTCAQNVMLPMDFAGRYVTPQAQYARARSLLEALEIEEQADKRPADVSGGQRQRVAIARALANDPIFIAADEPTGSLDSVTAQAIVAHFVKLAAAGTTILLATHDPELAARATRIVRIEDGRIVEPERP
ncbi:MAG: ABC transporter ATP-binding protein [Caldilineaceae bacterium]|nr:ABC transporter ATP-binding protein [Caldilineaceae bacterium]